jgi:hypothetical protein
MNAAVFLLGALLATSVYAQERHLDCSKAKDPKACDERASKKKANQPDARSACEGKQGAERGEIQI